MRISDWSSDVCSSDLWYHVTVREGRNRLVRRLIESQKLQVSRLIRISYGPIELGRGIKSGTAREATSAELLALLDAVQLSEADAGLAVSKPQPRIARGKSDAAPVTRPGRSRRPARDDDEDDGFERAEEHSTELQHLMSITNSVS